MKSVCILYIYIYQLAYDKTKAGCGSMVSALVLHLQGFSFQTTLYRGVVKPVFTYKYRFKILFFIVIKHEIVVALWSGLCTYKGLRYLLISKDLIYWNHFLLKTIDLKYYFYYLLWLCLRALVLYLQCFWFCSSLEQYDIEK